MPIQISLKAARVNAGLTQEDVARFLHKNKQTIVNWENGKTAPDVASFRSLCNLYKMDERYIVLPF